MDALERVIMVAIGSSLISAFGSYKDFQANKRFVNAIENARLVDVNGDGKLDIYLPKEKHAFLNTGYGFTASTNEYFREVEK
jgi:hypothetical protein